MQRNQIIMKILLTIIVGVSAMCLQDYLMGINGLTIITIPLTAHVFAKITERQILREIEKEQKEETIKTE